MEQWIPGLFCQFLPTASVPCKHESCIPFDTLCRIIVWDIETTKPIVSHTGEFFPFDMHMHSITCLINHTGHSDTVSYVGTHSSSENCFISTSQVSINIECVCITMQILLNRLVRASQDLHSGENGFLNFSWHINRLTQASQDFHSGENCFLVLSWHLNRLARASQDLYCG